MEEPKADEGLKRVIGVRGLAATVINNTIGAGIYVLPAIVSLRLGASGIIGYFFCAAVLVTIMLCYMEIGSKVTGSGGSYIYVEKAFGPFAGFIVNWLFFFGWGAAGSAAVINVLTDSLAVLIPAFSTTLIRDVLFFILLGAMVLLNIRGAKQGVKFVEYVTIIKILPLLAVIIFGIAHIKTANLHWEHLPPVKTIGETALVLFFAFAGFETSLNASGEIKDPKKTIPRGVIWGGAGVFVIYILLQTVTQGVLGGKMDAFKNAPLAAVAQNIVGPIGATLLVAGAIVSCLGLISGDILATSRLLFAGANDGLFPKPLGKVHPKFATPYLAIIVYAALIFIFAVSGQFVFLAVLASGTLLLIYLAVILAMIKLRKTSSSGTAKTFRVSGGLIIPLIAIAAIIWLLVNLSKKEIISTAVFIALVCAIYFIMMLVKKQQASAHNSGTN